MNHRFPSQSPVPLDLAIIGGGASGFFTALQYAELAPGKRIAIFEKGSQLLQKVSISGGGRCNVTHSCFDPRELAKNYPRGSKELLGAFHRWQPSDTVEWFAKFGVNLKTEPDGRMFPTTDSSETITRCFLDRTRDCGIPIYQKHGLIGLEQLANRNFSLLFEGLAQPVETRAVCIATGSLKGSSLVEHLKKLDLAMQPLVPSLFAFNVSDRRIHDLAGISHPKVTICREGSKNKQSGPLLVTHRGFSGPAVLRLSAWEARELAASQHHFSFLIDWLPELSLAETTARFAEIRRTQGAKLLKNTPIAPIPRRLWERIISCCNIGEEVTWGQLSKTATQTLIKALKTAHFEAEGKTTNKEEFVTAGGIERSSINFRTMESKVVPGLYFVGECIDLDGITGGFNFQAAWTTAHIAAVGIAARAS